MARKVEGYEIGREVRTFLDKVREEGFEVKSGYYLHIEDKNGKEFGVVTGNPRNYLVITGKFDEEKTSKLRKIAEEFKPK